MVNGDNIKVSIVIPVYNVESYILCCLQSVASQMITEGVECILVDDCGKDRSVEIAKEFVNSYQGNISFKILHHKDNHGLSAARNTGIRAARGEYLFFLDSDDEITADCLFLMINLATRFQADMVQGTYIGNHQVLSSFYENIPEFIDDRAVVKQTMLNYDLFPVMAQNRLVRKDVVLDNEIFFKEGIIHEDNHWTFFLAKYVTRLAVCVTPTYNYRITPGSITSMVNIEKKVNSFRIILQDVCNNMDPFMLGAQKQGALRLLNIAISGHYYVNDGDRYLFSLLYDKCRFVEKCALRAWFLMKESKINAIMFNLCVRLFS